MSARHDYDQQRPLGIDLPRRTKRLILAGSMLGMLMAALEHSVLNPAMPRIVSELGGLELYPWLIQSFIMAQVITIPISGALGDIWGRKPILVGGMLIFLLGCALCGFAGGIYELIAFRAVQGVGASLLMTSTFSVVGDLYPPSERGKYIGLFGGVFALSGLIGAPVGGILTEALSWRWVFWIMLFVGPFALAMVLFKMPWLRPPPKPHRFDFAGLAGLTVTVLPAMVALSLAGSWGWASLQVIGLFALSALGLIVFLRIERRAEQPIVPLHLFRIPTIATVAVSTFFIGVGMMGVMVYMQFFLQVGIGANAAVAGSVMGPMIVISVLFSIVSGQVMSRTGRYKLLAVAGSGLMLVGLIALSTMTRETTIPGVLWRMFIFGVGMGLMMPVLSIAAQNAAPQQYLGTVSGFTQFFQQVGGVIGIGLIGALFNSSLASGLASSLRADLVDVIKPEKLVDPLFHENLIAEIGQEAWDIAEPLVQAAVANAITDNFLLATGITAIAVLAILRMKEIRLRTGRELPGAQPVVAQQPDRAPGLRSDEPISPPGVANPMRLATSSAPQYSANSPNGNGLAASATANGTASPDLPAPPPDPRPHWSGRVAAAAFVGASVGLALSLTYRRNGNSN